MLEPCTKNTRLLKGDLGSLSIGEVLFFVFEIQKVDSIFSRSRINKLGSVSKLWFVGRKTAVLVFELTARFDHN